MSNSHTHTDTHYTCMYSDCCTGVCTRECIICDTMEMRNVEGIDGAAQCKLGSNFPFTRDNWIIRIADENIISHCLSGCQLCIIRIICSGSDRPTRGPCHVFCFRFPRLIIGWFQIFYFICYFSLNRKINTNGSEKTYT